MQNSRTPRLHHPGLSRPGGLCPSRHCDHLHLLCSSRWRRQGTGGEARQRPGVQIPALPLPAAWLASISPSSTKSLIPPLLGVGSEQDMGRAPCSPTSPSQSLAHKVLWMSEAGLPAGEGTARLGTHLHRVMSVRLGLASVTRENVVGATGARDFCQARFDATFKGVSARCQTTPLEQNTEDNPYRYITLLGPQVLHLPWDSPHPGLHRKLGEAWPGEGDT